MTQSAFAPDTISTLDKAQTVAILDCGAQYTKVIDRRIREMNICSEILPLSVTPEQVQGYGAIVLSGGPNSVFAADAPKFHPEILNLGIPIFGICYGMQLIAHHTGGVVQPGSVKEFGETAVEVSTESPLFQNTPSPQMVLMSHGDKVVQLPPGFVQLGASGDIVAAMGHAEKRIYGVQFHPEVELSRHGLVVMGNFLKHIAGLEGSYSLEFRLEDTLDQIRAQVGENPVFVLVSGGVDSAVTAALLLKALGPDQVYALHVDTGFMRHEESETVCEALRLQGLTHLQHLKAEDDFLNASTEIDGRLVGPLQAIVNPEEKRRIIGDVFFRLTQDAILKMGLDLDRVYIAQGTLRPDLIESGNIGVSQIAHKIKTHHNDVPVIQAQREKGMIVEPNCDLHKDEVRQIGRMLGLPEEVVSRHPFPGPGLAIRVLCCDRPYITDSFETLNQQVQQKAQALGLQGNILPVQSVGVQGDYRSYSYLALLSGSYTTDWNTLKGLAQEIPNTLHEINRVALLIQPEAALPAVIKSVTPTTLAPHALELLRNVDHLVIQAFQSAGLLSRISQLFAVLVPVSLNDKGPYAIALRAVVTSDYMTACPAQLGDEIPWDFIQGLAQTLCERFPISGVMYDLTSKPPATVEWE